jgi:hypothetical protein
MFFENSGKELAEFDLVGEQDFRLDKGGNKPAEN